MISLRNQIQDAFGVELPISGGDGTSFDNAIRIEVDDSRGVSIEYAVLEYIHLLSGQEWKMVWQTLQSCNDRSFDKLSVVRNDDPDQRTDYYFDISRFFGEKKSTETPLSKADLVVLYAKAWNLLDYSLIAPHLNEDVVYESQHVFAPLEGKEDVENHIKGKMETLRQKGQSVMAFAELSQVPYGPSSGEPCVLFAQGSKENIVALVLLETRDGKINRIDICGIAPDPKSAERTGIYPGLEV